ncbi:urease accessory protein UreE, partial [Halorubrum pallidum]
AFEPREAFVVEFPAAEAAVSTAVEFGHRVGNQHWDVAVEGTAVYIPVAADRAIIEDVLGPYLPPEATTRYETVAAERFIEDSDSGGDRGHGSAADHKHGQSHEQNHSHDHESGHGHDGHGHEHETGHGHGDHSHNHEHSHDHNGDTQPSTREGDR